MVASKLLALYDSISAPYRALIVVAAVILTSLFYVLHTLWFHPLARYPGPVFGRLTQWYDVYHAYIGDKHINFLYLHEKYGPVVRFSPNSISINEPVALKSIYLPKSANVQKSIFYKCFRAKSHAASTLLSTDKVEHARKRRLIGQAFNEQALRSLEPEVLRHVGDFIAYITDAAGQDRSHTPGWSRAIDMQKYCNWLVFDIMGDLLFGKSFGTLGSQPENREGIRLLMQAARRNYTVSAMPSLIWTGLERWVPGIRKASKDRLDYLAFSAKQLKQRQKEQESGVQSERRDIFGIMMDAKDPETGVGFPLPELYMEAATLIVAASDTSSTTMGAVLFYLLNNPATFGRLRDEILRVFKHQDEIRMGQQLQSCSYLRACIDETMRMTPAVAGLLPREVLPGGLYIPGVELHIPPGVDVGVPIYSIQHHPEYVWEPFKFDPSRWLSVAEGEKPHQQSREALNAVYTPFSLGNRACLGKPLVHMTLSVAIARLVWEFDMRLSPEQPINPNIQKQVTQGKRRAGEYHTLDWFLSRNEGPFVEFRVRKGLE